MIKKIVSGGQTGADQAALDVAIKLDIPHGGWIPKGRKTEKGILPQKYQLQEMSSGSYQERTKQNVIDSDATLIVTHGKLTGGSKLTQDFAVKHKKPYLHIDLNQINVLQAAQKIINWIKEKNIKVLNVAGSRASKDPNIYQAVIDVLETVFYLSEMPNLVKIPDQDLPKTVNQAVDKLISQLSFKVRTRIANMPEDDLIELHFSLGTYIRNEFQIWSGNAELMESCKSGDEILHEDDASSVIIKALWEKLKETHSLRLVKN